MQLLLSKKLHTHNLKIVMNTTIMGHFRNTGWNQRVTRVSSNTSTPKISSLKANGTEIGCFWRHCARCQCPSARVHISWPAQRSSYTARQVLTMTHWGTTKSGNLHGTKIFKFTGCQFFLFPSSKTKEGKNILISASRVQEKATGLLDSVSPHCQPRLSRRIYQPNTVLL